MSAALVLPRESEYLVPEERALAMIESSAVQIERAATIPDVKKIITQAEAIALVMKKIDASTRTKEAALRLRVQAEAQLGRISKGLPQGKRGAGAVPGQRTKRQILTENGIHNFRAAVAEKLAETPAAKVEAAIAAAQTLRAVTTQLGFTREYPTQAPRGAMQKLAHDAIGLLVQCQFQKRAPTAEEVEPLRDAFTRLS